MKLPPARRAPPQAKPPKGFVRLEGAETIPVGSTLDTAHGRVKIRSAADTEAQEAQTGQFFRGRFAIRQSRIKRRSKKLITDMRLTGSSFKKACRANRGVDLRQAQALEEARPAPVRRRQGLVPHQRAQRRGDRPRHALGRPGPLRRHAGDGPARARRGPRQGQAQDDHRADRAHATSPGPLRPRNRLRHGWARSSSSRRGRRSRARPRPLAVAHRAGAGRRRLHRRRL